MSARIEVRLCGRDGSRSVPLRANVKFVGTGRPLRMRTTRGMAWQAHGAVEVVGYEWRPVGAVEGAWRYIDRPAILSAGDGLMVFVEISELD